MSTARFMIERLRRLLAWRRYAAIVAEAAREALGEVEVYVIGGAAEGRLTALSDLDVLLVLPWEPRPEEHGRISRMVYEKAVEKGLPWDYPLNLHIAGPESRREYERLAKRMIRIL
ncbi:DNA polymerase beta domain protein region [Pyrolobus fumarii 1A]|uniref:DNA polymerase beta domain protein region n=1 Tax=Pyrolobus fumarii (strain DSM 11204 / 1A) TaxID=694429 RepID=G0EFH0_PYRF1|nr:nucleotidyltransferase domain-containing protein [Pyrolobus fumarii]AEM38994.1 DNA polymerase beta domain protein region [Pyrolobus fumarii 1A]